MSKAENTERRCIFCGQVLVRKIVRRTGRNPDLEPLGAFHKRRHCGYECWRSAQKAGRSPRPTCACGCGVPLPWRGHSKGWGKYAPGCYLGPKRKPRHEPWVDDGSGFWDWLAGFADGEGFFGFISRTFKRTYHTPVFKLSLRADDGAILEEIAVRTGCGFVGGQKPTYAGSKYQRRWSVTSMADCLRLIEIFDAHPLRAKKARDYATWRAAVLEKDQNGNTRYLDELVEKLVVERRWDSKRVVGGPS